MLRVKLSSNKTHFDWKFLYTLLIESPLQQKLFCLSGYGLTSQRREYAPHWNKFFQIPGSIIYFSWRVYQLWDIGVGEWEGGGVINTCCTSKTVWSYMFREYQQRQGQTGYMYILAGTLRKFSHYSRATPPQSRPPIPLVFYTKWDPRFQINASFLIIIALTHKRDIGKPCRPRSTLFVSNAGNDTVCVKCGKFLYM